MCGIAGIVGSSDPACGEIVRGMTDALVHRGPDDQGFWNDGRAWLGHRRLSIIDLAGGHQPMVFDHGASRCAIIFNGEIYNFVALQQSLVARGGQFGSHSDTEVLARLLMQGDERTALKALHGMFAFAWWDSGRQRLLLVRDRLGIKPLYYHQAPNGTLSFSSSLHSLACNPRLERRLDMEALEYLLTLGYPPPPLTLYEGVRELPPAHFLVWQDGTVHLEKYWEIDWTARYRGTEEEAAEQLSSLLDDVLRDHLVSDVPVAAFLSGGLDSSTVVARAARHADSSFQAFTISFKDPKYDESASARLVANHVGVRHTVTEMDAMPVDEEACRLVLRHVGQPFADSSCLPTYLVSRTAAQHVKVVLSGDGGDELFAGYDEFDWAGRITRLRRVPRWARRAGHGLLSSTRPPRQWGDKARQARKAFAYSLDSEEDMLLHLKSILDSEEVGRLTALFGKTGPRLERLREFLGAGRGLDVITGMSRFATMVGLPGDMLRKVDSMSMAASIEVRVPLLDHRLVEFAHSLPLTMKINNGVRKALLRRAIKDDLPQQIFSNPKWGFSIPLQKSFGPAFFEFCRDRFASPSSVVRGWFGSRCLEQLLAWNEASINPMPHLWSRFTASHVLWLLIQLEVWLQGQRVSLPIPNAAAAAN